MAKQKDIPGQLGAFADRILAELRTLYGERWDRFDAEDRELIARVARRAAEVTMLELAGVPQKRARLNIKAQLSNLKSAAEVEAVDLLWRSVWTVVSKSLAFAVAML